MTRHRECYILISMKKFDFYKVFFSILVVVATASAFDTFLTEHYIDSCIDKAFFYLNSSSDPGSGLSPEKAVALAKEIVLKLKSAAQNDANKKYILYKVNELEGQLYLEESGLLEEKENFNKRSANDLIVQFNSELAKERPSFMLLVEYRNKMVDLDDQKTGEIDRAMKKRGENLGAVLKDAIIVNLDKSNLDRAQGDLAYLQMNRAAMGISLAQYAMIAGKLQARTTIAEKKAFVVSTIDSSKAALAKFDFRSVHRNIVILEGKMVELKGIMINLEWEKLSQDVERVKGRTKNKEDSLTSVAYSVLRSKGVAEAGIYVDTLRKLGLPTDRISQIEKVLLDKAIVQTRQESAEKPSIVTAFILADEAEESVSALDGILLATKKKARSRNDSLKSFREENVRLTQIDEVRRDRYKVAQEERMKREQDLNRGRESQAQLEVVQLYALLEKGKSKEALAQFRKRKELFEKYLAPEDFQKLREAVGDTGVFKK